MTTEQDRDGAPRRRDAAASRQALLDAARELFGDRGYERTTLRDVGERAGVDAALVARYFGNKAALYSAAIEADNQAAGTPAVGDVHDVVELVLRRVDERGVGPLIQSLLHPQTDAETRTVVSGHLRRRLVDPLADQLQQAGAGAEDAARRAEVVVAAVLGVACVRTLGGFGELAGADRAVLVEELSRALSGV